VSFALVQSVTGSGTTIALNGVVAGHALTMKDSYFRATSTGVAETVPTDTNGTWAIARADAPALAGVDVGCGQFYLQNALAGTHTVTPQANSGHNTTLTEWSGNLTAGMFNDGNGTNGAGAATSQATGATTISSSIGDLVEIAIAHGDTGAGSANIGLTDPVSGYTTLQVKQDSTTGIAMMHARQILASAGTQSATFNWTYSASTNLWQVSIVTYKAAAAISPQFENDSWDREPLRSRQPGVSTLAFMQDDEIIPTTLPTVLQESEWFVLEPQTNPSVISVW
jgi:hypothetical protein